MAKWTRDSLTGESICAVCGDKRNGRAECCPTSPYISFDEFCAKFFSTPEENTWQNRTIAREFYSDYQHANYASVDDYLKACEA